MKVLDISGDSLDARERGVSNFALHEFMVSDQKCTSMESALQALKTPLPILQKRICEMSPHQAHKLYKTAHDADWQRTQRLHWMGNRFQRCSVEYYELVSGLYDALFDQSESYRRALQATQGYELQHIIGKHDQRSTVLTVTEFLSQVYRLRSRL
jgi:hypothetical protein